jgi:hypothetical protein
MTIKQQGGVFGRNPTFNDVTIDGTLTFNGDIDIDSDLKVSGDLDVIGAANLDGSVTINESAADKDFRVEGTTDSYLIYADADQQSVGIGISNPNSYAFNDPVKLAVGNTSGSTTLSIVSNPSSFGYLAFADGTSGASRYAGRIEYQHGTGSMYFYVNDGSQNINISSSGNLAFPSGQGIDFSATAGTGTSELLDDYEEGVWTPTYTTSGTDFDSVTYDIQTGSYVKIGELVTVFCAIRTNSLTVGSGTGNVRVGGLPFTVGSTADQWNNATAIRAGFVDATNFELVSCFGTEAVPRDINNNQAALTDLDTGANDNHLTFTLSYRV